MKTRIARFKDVVPTKQRHAEKHGIPAEVMEMITAKTTRNIMSPGRLPGQLSPRRRSIGGDAGVFRLGIVTCPPGNGPGLHVHYKTHETFMALTGRWEIQWGDKGEETTVLEPFDLIAVPPAGDAPLRQWLGRGRALLVIIQGQAEGVRRRRPRARDRRRDRPQARAGDGRRSSKSLGWKFTIGVEEAGRLSACSLRIAVGANAVNAHIYRGALGAVRRSLYDANGFFQEAARPVPVNPRLLRIDDNPFARLRALLDWRRRAPTCRTC